VYKDHIYMMMTEHSIYYIQFKAKHDMRVC
jgi:hypothetical protein